MRSQEEKTRRGGGKKRRLEREEARGRGGKQSRQGKASQGSATWLGHVKQLLLLSALSFYL